MAHSVQHGMMYIKYKCNPSHIIFFFFFFFLALLVALSREAKIKTKRKHPTD